MTEPVDMTDKYNTPLTPKEEKEYQAWGKQMQKKTGKNPAKDTFDYDMRGAWKSGAMQAGNMHWPDTYKKPNEPTFSTQSIYSGKDGYIGGQWITGPKGEYVAFKPSETNLKNMDIGDLQHHFATEQQGIHLILPPSAHAAQLSKLSNSPIPSPLQGISNTPLGPR